MVLELVLRSIPKAKTFYYLSNLYFGDMAFSFFKKKTKEEPKESRYLQLKVKEVRRETSDAVSLVFHQPQGGLKYQAGQFLTLILTINGQKIRRAYSLCSSPFLNEDPAVTVKKVEGGQMSVFLNSQVKVGDTIEVMEPMGHFVIECNPANKRHIVLFGGGSGITPLLSIIKSALHQEPQSTVSLVYCNRDVESVIFYKELETLQQTYAGKFNLMHVLEIPPANWHGHSGWLTSAKIKAILDELPQSDLANALFFTCGPAPMMDIVVEGLGNYGIAGEKIKRESFTAGETSPQDVASEEKVGESIPVKIILDGEEHIFGVSPNKSILETGLSLNIDMPYSCQSGLCTACRGKLLSGKVKMDEDDGLTQSEKEEGYVLCCVGHPITNDVVIEIG